MTLDQVMADPVFRGMDPEHQKEVIRRLQSQGEGVPAPAPPKDETEYSPTPSHLAGDVAMGAKSGYGRIVKTGENVLGIANRLGFPGQGARKALEEHRKRVEPPPEELGRHQGVAEQVAQAAGGAAADIPRYAAFTAATGSPVTGMAAADALEAADRGPGASLEAGARGAVTGKVLGTISKLPFVRRTLAGGGVNALVTAAAGGTPRDIASSGIVGAGLAAHGGEPEAPAGPRSIKEAPPRRELMAGERKPGERGSTSAPITRRSFQPQNAEDIRAELAKPDWVGLTATQEKVGPHDHPENVSNNAALEKELKSEGYNPTAVYGAYRGVEQGVGYHVPEMTEDEGMRFGKKYGQESIITPKGILFIDKSAIHPADIANTKIGPEAKKEDFYSSVHTASGEEIPYSIPIDWTKNLVESKPEPAPKPNGPVHSEEVRGLAEDYTRQHGIEGYSHASEYAQQPEDLLGDIADAYQEAKHSPDDPKVQAAYAAFKRETLAQFVHAADKGGIKFEPWAKEGQPYKNSAEMMDDVRNNKHLYFFTGGDFPEGHPLMEKHEGTGLTYNDLFRAVHDLYGHSKEGYQFGPRGEYNAFLSHSKMYSPEAQPAMASETLGQNAWVNYGKHIREIPELLRPPLADRKFAEQKSVLLPEGLTAKALGRPQDIYKSDLGLPEAQEPTVPVVAAKLQARTRKEFGTPPKSFESRVARLEQIIKPESLEQLARDPSSAKWYSEKVGEMDKEIQDNIPEAKKPEIGSIFKAILSITSNGNDTHQNIASAIPAFETFLESGKIPPKQPDGNMWPGRGPAIAGSLERLQRIIDDKGGAGKATEFLLTKQPKSELEKYSAPYTLKHYTLLDEEGKAYGASILGPKVGSFFLNMHGIPSLTIDRWVLRTAARAWGELVQRNPSSGDLELRPHLYRSKLERKAIINAFQKVADSMGLSIHELQALQWYYEKGLYALHGAGEEAQDFGEETRNYFENRKSANGNPGNGDSAEATGRGPNAEPGKVQPGNGPARKLSRPQSGRAR